MPVAENRRNRRRRGPKLLPKDRLRTVRVEVLLSQAEVDQIELAAAAAGKARAVYIRDAAIAASI